MTARFMQWTALNPSRKSGYSIKLSTSLKEMDSLNSEAMSADLKINTKLMGQDTNTGNKSTWLVFSIMYVQYVLQKR